MITVNYTCTCGQYIIAQGTFKNGDKIQCGKCGLKVIYQNGNKRTYPDTEENKSTRK